MIIGKIGIITDLILASYMKCDNNKSFNYLKKKKSRATRTFIKIEVGSGGKEEWAQKSLKTKVGEMDGQTYGWTNGGMDRQMDAEES